MSSETSEGAWVLKAGAQFQKWGWSTIVLPMLGTRKMAWLNCHLLCPPQLLVLKLGTVLEFPIWLWCWAVDFEEVGSDYSTPPNLESRPDAPLAHC